MTEVADDLTDLLLDEGLSREILSGKRKKNLKTSLN